MGEVVWSEREYASLEHLDRAAAECVAEVEAQRLSAHWGYVQWKRQSKNVWRIWEPGEDRLECTVKIIEHPDIQIADEIDIYATDV